jgi:acetylornithine/succinyldiaminopimelate/putrescine aminotransferase
MTAGTHGTTFGGNPLAMAVGNAVLDVVLADGFLEEVSAQGAAAQAGPGRDRRRVSRCDRGRARRGPDARPQVRRPNTNVAAWRCARRSCSAVPAGDNVVRLLPPLIVTDDEIRDRRRPHPRRRANLSKRRKRPLSGMTHVMTIRHFHRPVRRFRADDLRAILDDAGARKAA